MNSSSRVKEFNVYGPPGTGKTTYLSQQIRRAAEQFGPSAVMVASFTKTAAAEIGGRGLGLGERQVGTLHSFAYGAMGGGRVVEDRKGLEAWNESHYRHDRQLTLGGGRSDDLEFDEGAANNKTEGDRLFAQYKLLRNRMTPRELWDTNVLMFADDWEAYKEEAQGIDFSDMIEIAITEHALPLGGFSVAFLDEVQDLSLLELTYARMVGNTMDHFVLAGDFNQAIYNFKGATPRAFLEPGVPKENIRVLSKSHRVPAAVHRLAGGWQLLPLEYSPRDAEGEVIHRPNITPRTVEYSPVFDETQTLIDGGKTVMFLASASYMLRPLVKALKRRKIPFGNIYRPEQPEWNPLKSTKPWDPVSRLKVFLRDEAVLWGSAAKEPTYAELWQAVEHLEFSAFKPQAKALLKSAATNRLLKNNVVEDKRDYLRAGAFEGSALERFLWYLRNTWVKKQDDVLYLLELVERYGWEVLSGSPPVTVGTIHSVKGGQADHVFIFPDLSPSASQAWYVRGDDRDAIIRTFYVGLTRAKESVTLCGADKDGVNWQDYHAPVAVCV